MHSPDPPWNVRLATAAVFLFAFVLSLAPIRSYDYFWHLATGRWIVDNRALPSSDPFAVASDPVAWINGEWLFQIVLAATHGASGHAGVAVVRALLIAALFATLFAAVSRRAAAALAAPLVLICWYGAEHRLGARPETIATIALAAAVAMLLRDRWTWRMVAGYAVLTVFWINVHPSALLAPALAAIALTGAFIARRREGGVDAKERLSAVAGSAAALLVNPYGVGAVLAPLRLAHAAGGGEFVNLEWQPSSPAIFPLLYVMIALTLFAFVQSRAWRAQAIPFLLFVVLAVLSIRFLRNQGFYFAALPLLLGGVLPRAIAPRLRTIGAAATVAAALLLVAGRGLPLRDGAVDATLFPLRAVETLRELPLQGTIYNPDQLGGYLIWTFYPDRRVLTDGRNELHRTYIAEYGRARNDSRAWRALLDKYGVTAAVEEYRREPLEVVDARTGRRSFVAPSLAVFPRSRWALVAFDRAAMVFVDRRAVPAELLAGIEYRAIVPDARGAAVIMPGAARAQFESELMRVERESGSDVAARIAMSVTSTN